MSNDEKMKATERAAWDQFALKALEFTPMKQVAAGAYEPYNAQQMVTRAGTLATALLRERRGAFIDLDIWPEHEELLLSNATEEQT